MKNHKDYRMDIIHHNPHGCWVFAGWCVKKGGVERRGKVERSYTWRKGCSMVFVTRNRYVRKICRLIQENLRMQPIQRKQTLWRMMLKNVWAIGFWTIDLRSFSRYLLLACMTWASAWAYAAEPIVNGAVNADETLLATVQGKKVTVWEISSGKKLYDLTIPKESWTFKSGEYSGKISVVSFDPANKWVAIAGMANKIYFFDIQSREIIKEVSIPAFRVADLCIAPDKSTIAAIADNHLYGWDADSLDLLFKNDNLEENEDLWRCIFFDNHDIITISLNSNVRIYSNGDLIQKRKISNKNGAFDISLHPNKNKFAIAHTNGIRIGSFTPILEIQKTAHKPNDKYIRGISWSKDGKKLYFGGVYKNKNDIYPVFVLDIESKRIHKITESKSFIQKILALKNGNIIILTANPAWIILDKNGRILQFHDTSVL